MLKKIIGALSLAAALTASAGAYGQGIVVASWNIKKLGHGGQHSFPALAQVAGKTDLLAVQEVMTPEGAAQLEKALEKHTGEQWSALLSHAVGSRSYKEFYAFLWRDSAVEYTGGAAVYLDRGNQFIREPYSATFASRRDGSRLALATVHILFGDSVEQRIPEIQALDEYWLWLKSSYPGVPLALVGDFNLPESNPAWSQMKAHAQPLIVRGATTLSERDGRYANRYDNLWVEHGTRLDIREAGIIDFPKILGWTHSKSRKHVSDHAPVYMAIGNALLDAEAVRQQVPRPTLVTAEPAALAAGSLVRGNSASKIYHLPQCPNYDRISAKNLVEFTSAKAADQAGYRRAGNCH